MFTISKIHALISPNHIPGFIAVHTTVQHKRSPKKGICSKVISPQSEESDLWNACQATPLIVNSHDDNRGTQNLCNLSHSSSMKVCFQQMYFAISKRMDIRPCMATVTLASMGVDLDDYLSNHSSRNLKPINHKNKY